MNKQITLEQTRNAFRICRGGCRHTWLFHGWLYDAAPQDVEDMIEFACSLG